MLRAHPETILCGPCNPPPIVAPQGRAPWPQMEAIYGDRQRKYFGVKRRDVDI